MGAARVSGKRVSDKRVRRRVPRGRCMVGGLGGSLVGWLEGGGM